MKKLFTTIMVALFLVPAVAQKISRITLTNNGNFERIEFDLGESVVLYTTKDGKIEKWGANLFANRGDNYMDRLEEYTGKTGYFEATADSAYRGKIKFIGRTYFTYYSSYENEFLQGKLKTIGNMFLDYYLAYENEAYRGNIKSLGPDSFTWYSAFENEGLRGKLRSFGSTPFSYYSSFDDVAYRGRIKAIGNTSYTYYSSFDRAELRGSFKTGTQSTVVNGTRFFTRW